ncbi:MAG TPA: hypothetical protein VHW00_01175 [Thermoanaerobaculia bacterium]|nr:hypothetical protein [Thermoanaerobaculia bacterium]
MKPAVRSFALAFVALLAFTAAAQNEVEIKKYTNGFDADAAPGPLVTVGAPVTWTYVVTNTGSRELMNLAVTDDQGVTVTCPQTTLDAGLAMTCTASGTAVAGQYANIGTVTGQLADSSTVTDSDPSHYFGEAAPTLTFEKRTNGFDADTPPGPYVPAGSTVTWTYVITNVGSEALQDIAVADDQGVTVNCPATTLAPGQSMTCTGSGTAVAGQYANTGTVTATLAVSLTSVSASDPSHYFGQTLRFDKFTNGLDVASAPGPRYTEGTPITWTYEIENPGPAGVTNVNVVDDQGATVSCPATTLNAGASMTCSATGLAQPGLYANVGTVTAQLPAGGVISVSDTSYYLGDLITIEKLTNGIDADAAPGPTVAIGSTVNWTYVLTSHAPETLTGITVTDDQGVTVTCPANTLDAGLSMTCTASGVAIAGQYANVGTVDATSATYGAFSDSDASHYFGVVPAPSITATKTDSLSGNTIHYTITITNDGTGPASDVVFNDTPDANTTIVSGSVTTSAGTITSDTTTVSVNIGTINPSASVTIGFDVTITGSATSISNQGSVSGSNFTTVSTDDPDAGGSVDPTVTPLAATLSATKTDARSGDTIHYTIAITNSGNGAATGVVFDDTPDANTELVTASVTSSAGAVSTTPTSFSVSIGTIAPSATVTIEFDVTINDPLPVGTTTVANQGMLSGTNVPTSSTDDPDAAGPSDPTLTPVVAAPIVTASKNDALQNDVDHDSQFDPGDTIRYTITIANSGNTAATNVVFTDTPDANTTLVSGSVTTSSGTVTTGNSGGDTSVAVNVGTLNASQSVTITFDVVIDNPLPHNTTTIRNQGTVSGSNFTALSTDDPAAGGGTDPTTTTITPAIAGENVPTLGMWALLALSALLAAFALRAMS